MIIKFSGLHRDKTCILNTCVCVCVYTHLQKHTHRKKSFIGVAGLHRDKAWLLILTQRLNTHCICSPCVHTANTHPDIEIGVYSCIHYAVHPDAGYVVFDYSIVSSVCPCLLLFRTKTFCTFATSVVCHSMHHKIMIFWVICSIHMLLARSGTHKYKKTKV